MTPVPFDFDFAGLVNAQYAIPNEALPIDGVTDRLFTGSYQNEATLKEVLQLFIDKKEEMKSFVLHFEYLDQREREAVWDYLDDFYRKIRKESEWTIYFPKKSSYQDQMRLQRMK